MKLSKLVLLGLPLVLFGCPTDDIDTDTDPGETDTDNETDDTDIDTDTDVPMLEIDVELTNDPDTMIITLTNGTENYTFGYAQTAVEADTPGAGWFGEDCYLGMAGFNYCHPVGMTGATLTQVAAPGDIVEGQNMILPVDDPPSSTPALTYILIGETSGDCWVWGDDITYYGAFPGGPCTEYLAPM